MAAAQPDFSATQNQFLVSESLVLPNLGLSIFYNVWGDPSTRNLVGSFELMFGANKGITTGTIASVYNP